MHPCLAFLRQLHTFHFTQHCSGHRCTEWEKPNFNRQYGCVIKLYLCNIPRWKAGCRYQVLEAASGLVPPHNVSQCKEVYRNRSYMSYANAFSWKQMCVLITIYLKFVPNGPVGNKSALVEVKVWCCTGYKTFPEPKVDQAHVATGRHWVTMSL